MDKKFEIDIDFLSSYKPKEQLKSENFKESSTLFSIFDLNKDGEIDKSEVNNIFQQLVQYSEKNTSDTRQNAYAIFDETETQSFINECKTNTGQTFAQLGVTVKEVFVFLNTLLINADKNVESDNIEKELKIGKETETFTDFAEKESEAIPMELTDKQKQVALALSNIPERKDNQFSKQECELLAQLTEEELNEAKKYFYIESRDKQLSAGEIILLVRDYKDKYQISDDNFSRISELFALKDKNGNELSAHDIIYILSFNDKDKIDKALKILSSPEREYNNFTASNIGFIIKNDSQYLYDLILNNPNLELESQSIFSFVNNRDIREVNYNGITYRFVMNQELPEEVILQQRGNDLIEIVKNPNLNVIQTITYENASLENPSKNPSRIETQHTDSNGNVEYTEICENGDIPGTQNIYTIDKNGVRTDLQISRVDSETGIQTVIKNYISDSGISTKFNYVANPKTNEYEFTYEISDFGEAKSKTIYSKKQSLKQIDKTLFVYSNGEKTYNIDLSEDGMMHVIDTAQNKTYNINLKKMFPNEQDNVIAARFLRMPADFLVFLSEHNLEEINYGKLQKDDNGHYDKENNLIELGTQTQPKSETELKDTVFSILMHEFGHFLDNKIGELPDSLSTNEDFIRCFDEEVENFKKNHTSAEQNYIGYFSGATTMEGVTRGRQEAVAEINMLLNTVSKEVTSARAYLLQRYFPKTIAFIANMIQQGLQE